MGGLCGILVRAFELKDPGFGEAVALDRCERVFADDLRISDKKLVNARPELESYLLSCDQPVLHGWYELGVMRTETREWAKAVSAFTHVVDADPESGPALGLLAWSHLELGNRNTAVELARRAWRLGFSQTWARSTPEQEWEFFE
jgi:hypothetical protein